MTAPERHYHLFATDLGTCGIAWTAEGLVRVQLPDRDPTATVGRLAGSGGRPWSGEVEAPWQTCVETIRRHISGEPVDYSSIPLDWRGIAPFNRRIYEALRNVPFGQTTTYGGLAATIGEPGAARAIGLAMGRNPWPIVVPCHRVLKAGGRMGGFSAPGGTLTKEVLLAREGIDIGNGTPLLPGLLPGNR